MANGSVISAAVEGIVDEAVARAVIAHAGGIVGDVYGKQGKEYLRTEDLRLQQCGAKDPLDGPRRS